MAEKDWRAELDQLLSKQALHELLAAYCRAVDRADGAALAALFHPGAVVHGGVVNGDAEHFAREAADWIRANAKAMFHAIANEWFAIDGDCAQGECYVFAISTTCARDGDLDTLTAGRYLDRFERRNGVWKFTERRFVMDCNINQPSSGVYDERIHPPGWMRGAYAPHDPSAEFWQNDSAPDQPPRRPAAPP